MSQIVIEHLRKYYDVHQKEPGLAGSLRSFVRRTYHQVKAVDGISFSIEPGEMVGFLGPNGAGKTTTLKVLSGLLYPTGGRVEVLGFTPHERRSAYLEQFTLVMGQKNQYFPGVGARAADLRRADRLRHDRASLGVAGSPEWRVRAVCHGGSGGLVHGQRAVLALCRKTLQQREFVSMGRGLKSNPARRDLFLITSGRI